MTTAPLANLRQNLDDWRVRQHFKCVELILRNRDVSHLPPHLQYSREHYLDVLHDYAIRGVFPRNHERAGISPCFIDRDGRECAVAHLVMHSGHDELAYKIAIMDNYATVPQMQFPELDAWESQAGLTHEELTLIQPGYWYSLSDILPLVLTAWVAGIMTVVINVNFVVRKRMRIIEPLMGIVATIALFIVAYICFAGAQHAYNLGSHPDGAPYDYPLRDVGPLAATYLISTAMALLTVNLTIRGLRNSYVAMHDRF